MLTGSYNIDANWVVKTGPGATVRHLNNYISMHQTETVSPCVLIKLMQHNFNRITEFECWDINNLLL